MKVSIIPEFPQALMTGGTLVQAEKTCEALIRLGSGLDAELFNWSDRRPMADLYHFISIQPYQYAIAEMIRIRRRPYVITSISGMPRGRHVPWWLMRARFLVRTHLLGGRARQRAFQNASKVIVLTPKQGELMQHVFGVPHKQLEIVPNGVDDLFFHASPHIWRQAHRTEPFVLCVGAVQNRKGQLLLAESCNRLRLPVVLLGPVLPGEETYAASVREAMQYNQKFGGAWLQNVRHDDPLLASAYSGCRIFVLLSSCEAQPLSVLEAMAAKKPILLLQAPYSGEPPFARLPQVQTPTVSAVCETLQREWDRAEATSLTPAFSWRAVADRLRTIYQAVLSESQATPRNDD
jgi:glycosyltransferase involved in cell wall biosynthesis